MNHVLSVFSDEKGKKAKPVQEWLEKIAFIALFSCKEGSRSFQLEISVLLCMQFTHKATGEICSALYSKQCRLSGLYGC